MGIGTYLALASVLFGIGAVGFLTKPTTLRRIHLALEPYQGSSDVTTMSR